MLLDKIVNQLDLACYILRTHVSSYIFHDDVFQDDYSEYRSAYKKLESLQRSIQRLIKKEES
jgi:hypothetical protein